MPGKQMAGTDKVTPVKIHREEIAFLKNIKQFSVTRA